MVDKTLVDEAIKTLLGAGVDPATCNRAELAHACGISGHKAREIIKELRRRGERTAGGGEQAELSETHERTDEEWVITLPRTRVSTLEELLARCKVDLDVWEVERWVCNKWEVGMKPPATTEFVEVGGGRKIPMFVRKSGAPIVEPLFQVKAWLIRKDAKRLKGPDSKSEFLKQFKEILEQDVGFKFQTKPTRTPRPDDAGHSETAVVLCSDIHLAETIRPEDANGVNFYNSIVASNRLWEHSQKVRSIIGRHMSLYKIDRIWSPVLGDILNGTIHEEYVATNDLSDPAAVILGARLLRMFYEELKGLGLPIEIDAVHGNHARLTPKVPTKRQAHTNLDWQCYEMLADRFVDDDQVSVAITTAQIGMKKIFDWNYVFEHGIDVKNGREEDFEDRVRALFDDPTFREATGYQGASFDQIIIGNLHKPKFLERTVVNGSYIGQNELGQSWRLKPIRAQQLTWGVSEKYPRTWQYNIDLTPIKSEAADNPFSEYACWFMKRHGQ